MESSVYSKIQTNNFIFDISHSRFYFLLFGREFLSLFTNEEAVIEAGLQRTRIMSFSYAVSAFMDCTAEIICFIVYYKKLILTPP